MTYYNFPLPTIVYNCLQRPVRPLWFSHLSHIHQLALVKSNTAHTCSEYMLSTHYAMRTVDQRCSMKLNVFFWTFAHLFCLASGRPILTPAHLPPEQLVQRNLLSKASRIRKYKQDKPSCKPCFVNVTVCILSMMCFNASESLWQIWHQESNRIRSIVFDCSWSRVYWMRC